MHVIEMRLGHGGSIVESAKASGSGRYRIRIIAPGKGSSGTYTPENLAASAPVFRKGTHMYMDHPSTFESETRPERSIKDLAGVFESDATVGEDGALYADIRVFESFDAVIREKWDVIGVSINAFASGPIGESGIVPPIAEVRSVDFVTVAGAQGAIVDILESRRVTTDSPENGVNMDFAEMRKALATDISEALASLPSLVETIIEARKENEEKKDDEKDDKPADSKPAEDTSSGDSSPDDEDEDEDEDEKKKAKESAIIEAVASKILESLGHVEGAPKATEIKESSSGTEEYVVKSFKTTNR